MKVTKAFFDRQAVTGPADKARKKNLSRAGAFIRRRARSSIRRRKSISAVGQPPSAHSRDKVATIKNILFAYDAGRDTVVVGPVRLNGRKGDVPPLLEVGGKRRGPAPVRYVFDKKAKRWKDRSTQKFVSPSVAKRSRAAKRRRSITLNYRPRPFMTPALKAEAPNFAGLWEGSVKPS